MGPRVGLEVQVLKLCGVRYSLAEIATTHRSPGPNSNRAQGSAVKSISCDSGAGGFAEHALTVCRACAL